MHDASGAGQEDTWTLRQGLGAVVWASPSEQAKHPAIVLAPQYDEVVTDDSYAHTKSAELTAGPCSRLCGPTPSTAAAST